MLETLKKFKSASKYLTTYRAGLLQAKAYRILKQHTANVLKDYDMSTLDWAIVGLLFDSPKSVRFSYIAEEVGVEAPLVTRMINKLKSKDMVDVVVDKEDSRAKLVVLTDTGRKLVEKIERELRAKTKPLFEGASIKALAEYIHVLETVVNNDRTGEKKQGSK